MSRGRTKRLERLARWYWTLPETERERVKQLYSQRMRDDPEFRAEVANSLRVAELRKEMQYNRARLLRDRTADVARREARDG
jgi:hypothetical protein